MIKPEFFDSESLALCSIEARLAFVGLWVMGDDYGNQKAQLSRLKHRIFPYDKMPLDAFLDLLCELEEVGCIKGYEIEGDRYITVTNFSEYQTVRKPSKTTVPEPPKPTQKARVTNVIRGWRTGNAPVAHQCCTSDGVTHYDVTSVPERKKEGKKEVVVLQQQLPKEGASDGAAVASATPSSAQADTKVPVCPLCSKPVRFDANGFTWRCPMCGDVKEPAFVNPGDAA